jgi:DNA-binding NtrC family response regulator
VTDILSLEEMLAEVERQIILDVLERTGHHLRATAEILGVHISTLTRRLRQYDLDRGDRKTKSA